MKNNYIIGTKNESFGPGGIQNAINDTLVKTKGAVDAKLIEKNISENGVYKAKDNNVDGYSSVTVDIPEEYNGKFEIIDRGQYTDFNIRTNLKVLSIPEGVTRISNSISSGGSCPILEKIEIPSSIISIDKAAFNGCSTVPVEIIVNKPEGSVSDAPWGAKNATVIWKG